MLYAVLVDPLRLTPYASQMKGGGKVDSRGTKKKRKNAQEKEERVSITIYLHKGVWNDFQKFIAPSGISASRMMEAIMRVACNQEVALIWERI